MASPALTRAPWRIRIAFLLVLGVGGLLAARLFYWQIIQWDRMRVAAEQRATVDAPIPARRGDIRTSEGLLLAGQLPVVTISAAPKRVENADQIALELAPILGQPVNALQAKLDAKTDTVVLARGVSIEIASKIQELKRHYETKRPDPGFAYIDIELTTARQYPLRTLAAPLVGYLNAEGKPAYGIEQYKDRELRGTPGTLHGAVDVLRGIIPGDLPAREAPTDGADIVLTINAGLQRIAETELGNAIKETRAASGSIVILDPKTGAILAMAVLPTADLNEYFKSANAGRYVNTAIMSEYEPGSVFKIITVAAGLDAGTISPGSVFDDNGSLAFGGITVSNHDRIAPGRVTLTQVLQKSLNVEAAKISIGLGVERFYEYVNRFGFGAITRVELGGETAGAVKAPGDGRWRDSDLATNGYGQGISVTPLQMAVAVAAVANQGKLMHPFIISETQDPTGRITRTQPQVVRQVIRPETAKVLTQLLADAIVAESTNKAVVPGYRVAGKTGTAQIPTYGGYDPRWTIASFAGFLPADDPRLVILVKLDKPQTSEWGSQVASPVFASVAKQSVALLGVPPDAVRLAQR